MHKYYQLSKFHSVLECIDGSHIAVRSLSKDEHLFVNRKCFHSMDIQRVYDADLKFTNIVAKWPGSSHVSFIWTDSVLSTKFESGIHVIISIRCNICLNFVRYDFSTSQTRMQHCFWKGDPIKFFFRPTCTWKPK